MGSSGRSSELPRRQAAINASLKIKELCRRNVRANKNVAGSKSGFSIVQSGAVLPIELIGDILSRLPPKYLIRLQLVCKEWKTLILGHYFMERYKECYKSVHCWYNVTSDQSSINERSPSLVFGFDGLLLLRSENLKYFLWNPATRLILELPKPNYENKGNCVFTYVPATKSYRLVSIHKDAKSGVEGCEVLTPGTSNKWRSLEFPATVYPVDGHRNREKASVVLAGAAVHYTRVLEYGKEVVSLDVASECFTVNSLPKNVLSNWKKAHALDWEGKFAFAEKDREHLIVVVLENYKKNKWGRKMKISLLPLMKKKIVDERDHLVPLFAKNGVVWIWLEGKKILTFTIETGETVDIQNISFRAVAEKFYPYKPSLVTFEEMKPDTQFQNLRALIL